ncbi:DUF6157 family protein [Telluribacter sp.]|jgi:hypothetical protein|uniref:DUF6157 family protein n=1 Tax=Telluribacter sp. TaxID=1978767 RepID=UPI002E147193|nr:DUF6157 family protein [Telluribacter sp.]
MKTHSTNYFDTFIEVAEDTKVNSGVKPPTKEKASVAEIQYELIAKNPYKYTSDDIFFQIYADRNDLTNRVRLVPLLVVRIGPKAEVYTSAFVFSTH